MTGVNDSTATTLSWPRSVRLDSQLNLYVADSNNHRIQKILTLLTQELDESAEYAY